MGGSATGPGVGASWSRHWSVAAGPIGGKVGHVSLRGNMRSESILCNVRSSPKDYSNYKFKIFSGKPPSNRSLKQIPQGSNNLNHLSLFSDLRKKSTPIPNACHFKRGHYTFILQICRSCFLIHQGSNNWISDMRERLWEHENTGEVIFRMTST